MSARRKISSVRQYFDEEESNKKVVCQLSTQKLAYRFGRKPARRASYYQQHSADKYYNIFHSNPQTLWCRPVRNDNAIHHWNDCLWSAATMFCWRQRFLQVNALYWAWVYSTDLHNSNVLIGAQPHVFWFAQSYIKRRNLLHITTAFKLTAWSCHWRVFRVNGS